MSRPAVAYCRVSTREQGHSGLGLEAQRATIERIAAAEGFTVETWYTETQSGKGGDALAKRPQLLAAINHAARIGGTVVVAKLDRLSRNVHFISGLMESKAEFRSCDLPPEAPKLMLHIFAVLAEWERDMISKRTVDALSAAKARGQRLGSPRPAAASAARVAACRERDVPLLRAAGSGTLAERAARLNRLGFRTANGKEFKSTTVQRMDRRHAAATSCRVIATT